MKKKKLKKMVNKFALVDDIQHLHERIDALEKVKIDPANKHLQELDGVIKDLLDSDNKFLDRISRIEEREQDIKGISEAQVLQNVYNRMANRGATKEELDAFREVIHKYDATSVKWEDIS